MLQLLYYYGGLIVPNSFLCTRSLLELYTQMSQQHTWFVCENINRTLDTTIDKLNTSFIPDIVFTGCLKNNPNVLELINNLKMKWNGHFSQEMEFQGFKNHWLLKQIELQKIKLVDGQMIGIKKRNGKPILIDDLMEEAFLDVDMDKMYGIYIPKEELLKRTKYQWFAILSTDAVLECNIILAKFFKTSIMNSIETKHENTEIQSLIAL